MKAIKKLKSNKGATIIFAMAIFLVAVILSVSLITISMTAVKSTSRQLEDEQAYLAVSSAARLFQKQIEGATVDVTYEADDAGNLSNSPEAISNEDVKGSGLTGPVKDFLKSWANPGSTLAKTFTITPSDAYADKIDVVQITISADTNTDVSPYHGFKAVLKNVPNGGENSAVYETTMYFYVYCSSKTTYKNVNDSVKPEKKVDTLCWKIYGEKNGDTN